MLPVRGARSEVCWYDVLPEARGSSRSSRAAVRDG